jgi:ATP-dependent protease ClpP protease subunit
MIPFDDTWIIHKKRKFEFGDDLAKRPTKKIKITSEPENKTTIYQIPLDKDEPKDHSQHSGNLIYSNDNHIYFYTVINNRSITMLQKEVQNVINKIIKKSKSAENLGFTIVYPPIVLHINSPGGNVFASFKFIDYMTQIKRKFPEIKFHSIVEGLVASAATFISVTADKRFITEYGYMLIHQLWSCSFGKYNELKDDVSNCDILMERIKNIYRKHAKIPNNQLDEILKHDLYWDSKTCKKYKLVDIILN